MGDCMARHMGLHGGLHGRLVGANAGCRAYTQNCLDIFDNK